MLDILQVLIYKNNWFTMLIHNVFYMKECPWLVLNEIHIEEPGLYWFMAGQNILNGTYNYDLSKGISWIIDKQVTMDWLTLWWSGRKVARLTSSYILAKFWSTLSLWKVTVTSCFVHFRTRGKHPLQKAATSDFLITFMSPILNPVVTDAGNMNQWEQPQ